MTLPNDPVMLLSVVNMKLRDLYPTLDALCEDLDQDETLLRQKLSGINYRYDPEQNQFI